VLHEGAAAVAAKKLMFFSRRTALGAKGALLSILFLFLWGKVVNF
jgi:hypothetical protein